MMARVTIQHQCGHTTEEVIGETSSAGIGAAVAGLQATDCAACLALPTDAATDAESILRAADRELEKAYRVFLFEPGQEQTWDVLEAVRRYQAAYDDWQQEANRCARS